MSEQHGNKPYVTIKKLVIVGDGYCGKTWLLHAFWKNEFPDMYTPLLEFGTVVTIEAKGKLVELQLWDTNGQEDYDRLRPISYPDTDVILVCFSVINPASLENVTAKWVPEVRHFCSDTPIILVGTKTDFRKKPDEAVREADFGGNIISVKEGWVTAETIGALAYVECSARTQERVKEVLMLAANAPLKMGNESKRMQLLGFMLPTQKRRTVARKKLVAVGDCSCGKTSLLWAFTQDEFPTRYDLTYPMYYTDYVEANGKLVSLLLRSSAGVDACVTLDALVCTDPHVLLACFSVDSPDSLVILLTVWTIQMQHHCPSTPVILVANKSDLRNDADVISSLAQTNQKPISKEVGSAVAHAINAVAYIECSAKTREGIKKVFTTAASVALQVWNNRSSTQLWRPSILRKRKSTKMTLVAVGDSSCGKTCVLLDFCRSEFPAVYTSTAFETYVAETEAYGKLVDLTLWDMAGADGYSLLRPIFYPDAHIILVCFSVDNPESLANVVKKWKPEVRGKCPQATVILVANKTDLREDPGVISSLAEKNQKPVSEEEGAEVAKTIGAVAYVECSAKTRKGVKEVLTIAAKAVLKKKKKPTKKRKERVYIAHTVKSQSPSPRSVWYFQAKASKQ